MNQNVFDELRGINWRKLQIIKFLLIKDYCLIWTSGFPWQLKNRTDVTVRIKRAHRKKQQIVPPRTLSKASSVKWIKTIRLGYVVDAATFDIIDIMALMVFAIRFCKYERPLAWLGNRNLKTKRTIEENYKFLLNIQYARLRKRKLNTA